MAIKINNKNLARRVINWQDVQRVVLNWSQIRPTSQPHIDYHVISNRGTWWGGGGWSGVPWGWGIWGSTVIGETWVSNWGTWETANLQYNWLPSLLNAYKVEIIYSFYRDWTDVSTPFESYLLHGSEDSYRAKIYKQGAAWTLYFQISSQWYQTYIADYPGRGDYVMTAVLDLENETATLTLSWPSSYKKELEISLTDADIYEIRHSDEFWVYLNDWVRLSRVDFYVYNNPQSPSVWAWIYHNTTLGLISLSSDWENWITIADKNLWARTVRNDWDLVTARNNWWFFQWGNNYMFPFTWARTTSWTRVDTTWYWPWNYYNSDVFITWNRYWSSVDNVDLWWGYTDTYTARRGPCPEGYHVPSKVDSDMLIDIANSLGISSWDFRKLLKIPLYWWLDWNTWQLADIYSPYSLSATSDSESYEDIYVLLSEYSENKAWGRTIRPFKNTYVEPDSTRTVLYQPS